MSNRTDFDNQAAEFLDWQRSAATDEAKARLERELNDAFVAGQEHEDRDLRAALAEALDMAEQGAQHPAGYRRIAELRAKFLGGSKT